MDHEQQKATKTETPKMEQIFVPKHVPYSKESKKKFTPFFFIKLQVLVQKYVKQVNKWSQANQIAVRPS